MVCVSMLWEYVRQRSFKHQTSCGSPTCKEQPRRQFPSNDHCTTMQSSPILPVASGSAYQPFTSQRSQRSQISTSTMPTSATRLKVRSGTAPLPVSMPDDVYSLKRTITRSLDRTMPTKVNSFCTSAMRRILTRTRFAAFFPLILACPGCWRGQEGNMASRVFGTGEGG
ncbi:hypothetical protein DFH11DRAFT_356590 [Phellopilus nigrolimitatus]|nr:hypothetical protein DFH11DRAFT_356590 [Phellopilus nigrolimitatus]